MRDQSVQTDVTTDPTAIADGTFAKTSTSVSFTCSKAVGTYTQIGIEILDNAGVVIRRGVQTIGVAAAASSTVFTATITGLTPNTIYKCRGFRGDEGLAPL
jgi:predicted aconitase